MELHPIIHDRKTANIYFKGILDATYDHNNDSLVQ